MHNDWDVAFTCGSLDACNKIFEMMIDENESILLQTPTYTGTLGAVGSFRIISRRSFNKKTFLPKVKRTPST